MYWILSSHFLRLAHESSIELINTGNARSVTSASPISASEVAQKFRWSDHSVGIAILFSYFHGIELTLKGFLKAVGNGRVHHHHHLTHLLADFESAIPGTDLAVTLRGALSPAVGTPLQRFLVANGIHIDSWYEALKYPESKTGSPIDHFDLKFGGESTLPFWTDVMRSAAEIHGQAAALATKNGYA